MAETILNEVENAYNQEKLVISDTISVSFTDNSLRGVVENFCKQAAEDTGFPSNHEHTDQPIVIVDLVKNYAADNGHSDLPLQQIPQSGFMLEIFHDHIYLTGDNKEGVKLGLRRLLEILNVADYTEAGIEIKGQVIIEGPLH